MLMASRAPEDASYRIGRTSSNTLNLALSRFELAVIVHGRVDDPRCLREDYRFGPIRGPIVWPNEGSQAGPPKSQYGANHGPI